MTVFPTKHAASVPCERGREILEQILYVITCICILGRII